MITQKEKYRFFKKQKKFKLAFLFAWIQILTVANIIGQSIEPAGLINNSHYYKNANGISLQSSCGELAIERFSEEGQVLTQGFLQQYTLLVPTDDIANKLLTIKIGPNPCTSNFSIIKSTDEEIEAYLFDTNQRLLKVIKLEALNTIVDVSTLPASTYFLNIFKDESQIFKTIKIIKN